MNWEQLLAPENRWALLSGLGVLGGLVLTLIGLFVVRRYRRGKAEWQQARSSARGMQLGMQGKVEGQDFSSGA